MKKIILIGLLVVSASANAGAGRYIGDGYTVSGATDLKPVEAQVVDGHLHLFFDRDKDGRKPLPAVFALDDNGRYVPVNVRIVSGNVRTEYVLATTPSPIILRFGRRDAIVQDGLKPMAEATAAVVRATAAAVQRCASPYCVE